MFTAFLLAVLLVHDAAAAGLGIRTNAGKLELHADDVVVMRSTTLLDSKIREKQKAIQTLVNSGNAQATELAVVAEELKELQAQAAEQDNSGVSIVAMQAQLLEAGEGTAKKLSTIENQMAEAAGTADLKFAALDEKVDDVIAASDTAIDALNAVIETAVTDGVDAVKDDLIDVSKDLADAQAELLKAQACGAKAKIYTKDGCLELPSPYISKYTEDSKCNEALVGAIEYSMQDGHMCLNVCDGKAFVPSTEGGLGEKCNPAPSCAKVVEAKLPSGVYNFVVSAGKSRRGYCNVISKKISYDGSSKENFALTCNDVFLAFPFFLTGTYFVGADAKKAEEMNCKKPKIKPAGRDPRIPVDGLFAWYDAEDYNGATWNGRSPAKRTSGLTFIGTKPDKENGGEGAHSDYAGVRGDTAVHKIRWGPIVPGTFTLCTTSAYAPKGHKGRIFTGNGNNWLHGHHGGNAGSSYYEGWKVSGWANSNPGKESWIAWCATNGKDGGIWGHRKNGDIVRAGGGVKTSTNEMGTGWGTHSGERSSYRIGTVMSWSRSFTTAEMKDIMGYLVDHLKGDA